VGQLVLDVQVFACCGRTSAGSSVHDHQGFTRLDVVRHAVAGKRMQSSYVYVHIPRETARAGPADRHSACLGCARRPRGALD
jgi:hypothetical protein